MALLDWYNYWLIVVLILVGLYGMVAMRNLLKKLMGMNVVQVGVILLFLSFSPKHGATIPVEDPARGEAVARQYANPLPQALMLTAIVVSIATTGVGLALLILIHRRFGSLDEAEVLKRLG